MPTRAPIFQPHPPRKARQTNRQATRALNTNSKAWKDIRSWVLVRDRYRCAMCGRFGDHVDHIDGDSNNDAKDGSNYQTLCRICHGVKTARERQQC